MRNASWNVREIRAERVQKTLGRFFVCQHRHLVVLALCLHVKQQEHKNSKKTYEMARMVMISVFQIS